MKHIFEKSMMYLLMIIFTIFFLFPIYWAITMSFKTPGQIFVTPPEFFPSSFHLDNYVDIFSKGGAGIYFLNSLIVSITTTVVAVLFATMAGYGFSRYKFKGKYTALYTVIIVRMIPGLVYTIPFYIIYQNLGMLNSLTGLVISYITFSLPLAIWLFMGFYDQIPTEVFESAIIDGCNDYGVFRHIAIKLVLPGIVVASILIFLGAWNEFGLALVLLFTDAKKTLPIGINGLIVYQEDTPFGSLAAAGTIAMLPAIILSLTTQKFIVRGLTDGAVKG